MENDQAVVLWDLKMISGWHKHCNKPDIVIKEKETARYVVYMWAVPIDYNIQKKTAEKTSKYADLQIEMEE